MLQAGQSDSDARIRRGVRPRDGGHVSYQRLPVHLRHPGRHAAGHRAQVVSRGHDVPGGPETFLGIDQR